MIINLIIPNAFDQYGGYHVNGCMADSEKYKTHSMGLHTSSF